MAHIGEKGALGLVGRFGGAPRPLQFANVMVDQEIAQVDAVLDNRHTQPLHIDQCAILAIALRNDATDLFILCQLL